MLYLYIYIYIYYRKLFKDMIVQSKEEGCSEKQQENAIKGRSRFYLPIFLQRPNKPFEILSTRIREKIIIFKFSN